MKEISECHNKICDDRVEVCRDGNCQKILDNFCFSTFDCGPQFQCQSNKCVLRHDATAPSYSRPRSRCDPGEFPREGNCVKLEGF